MEDTRQEKQRLRALVAQRRRDCPEQEQERMSAWITQKLLALPACGEAEVVFAYMDLPGEVRMRPFLIQCLAQGKRIALPRVEGAQMRFYEVDALDGLREGAMHILEPDPARHRCADAEERALVVMPGVAFDKARRRIGYGGGYYDRYLAAHPHHLTVAVAYPFQIFARVPGEETDVRPDILLVAEEEPDNPMQSDPS